MSVLRLAIVGCGDISRYTAAFALLNSRIKLSACCDINPETAQTFARRFRIRTVFTEYAQMLSERSLDAVYLAVPHDLHLEMVQQAVSVGKAVLCEKPLAASLEQGRKLIELTEQTNVPIAVNYQYRYDQACYALVRAVHNRDLGEIYLIKSNVPWHRQAGYFAGDKAWHYFKERTGGGTLLTQGSHFLDVMLWAADSTPVKAVGKIYQKKFKQVEVEDLAVGIIEMENSTVVEITSSMVAKPEQSAAIEVYGERGTVLYRDGLLPRVQFLGVRVQKARPPVRGIHALARSLEAFRRYVLEGLPYLSTPVSAFQTLAAVHAIYRSAQSGCTEIVPR